MNAIKQAAQLEHSPSPIKKLEDLKGRILTRGETTFSERESRPSVSVETASLLSNKLRQLASKGRVSNQIRKKEHKVVKKSIFRPVHHDDDDPIEGSLHIDGLDLPDTEGYLEKLDKGNEAQSKAKQALLLIKKNQKKKDVKVITNFKPELMPFLHAHMSHSASAGQLPALEAQRNIGTIRKGEIGASSGLKIDDPNSILHVSSYKQNKDFLNYAKPYVNDEGKKFLKLNAPDCHTFFRLNHELTEISRKRTDFLKMKEKFFDNKNPEDVIQYDSTLRTNEFVESPDRREVDKKLKGSKDYQHGKKIAEKLTESANAFKKNKMNDKHVVELFSALNNNNKRFEKPQPLAFSND